MVKATLPARVNRGLTAWFGRDPFHALQAEMDDMLNRFSERWGGEEGLMEMRVPPMDLSENDNEVLITMDVPGMKPEEIDIEVTGNMVHVRGEHKEEKEEKGRTYRRVERRTGSFTRTIELPCPVMDEKVAAEYKEGVLKLTLPKCEEARTRKIKVAAAGVEK